MAGKFNPVDSGYIEVKDRIEAFYAKHPEGAIRTNIFDYREDVVIVTAECFANREDTLPIGTGSSALKIPGGTPYTKDSELENAETSAVGRAIAMAGFEVKRSVASADEIRMKERGIPEAVETEAEKIKREIREIAESMYGTDWKTAMKEEYGIDGRSSMKDMKTALMHLKDIEIIEAEGDEEARDEEDSF